MTYQEPLHVRGTCKENAEIYTHSAPITNRGRGLLRKTIRIYLPSMSLVVNVVAQPGGGEPDRRLLSVDVYRGTGGEWRYRSVAGNRLKEGEVEGAALNPHMGPMGVATAAMRSATRPHAAEYDVKKALKDLSDAVKEMEEAAEEASGLLVRERYKDRAEKLRYVLNTMKTMA